MPAGPEMLKRIQSLSLLSMASPAPSAPNPALAALLDGEQWNGTPPPATDDAATTSADALEGAPGATLVRPPIASSGSARAA